MKNENKEEVGLFPQKGKKLDTPNKESLNRLNAHNFDERLGEHQAEQSAQEDNEDLQERGSYQPPDRNNENQRGRSRSPESISNRDRYRYEVTDRRIIWIIMIMVSIIVKTINLIHSNEWNPSYL